MIPPAVGKLAAYAEARGARVRVVESVGKVDVRRKREGEFVLLEDVPVSVVTLRVDAGKRGRGYFAWRRLELTGEGWKADNGNWRSASFIGLRNQTQFKQMIGE